MNRLFDLAVNPSELGMALVAAETQAEARAVIGAGTGDGTGGGVDSVNGQTGAVVLRAEDVQAVPNTAPGTTVAQLVDGKIPTDQLPALAITQTFVVNSQAAQLALEAQEGDVCIRTDENLSYIHTNSYTGTMTDWTVLLSPTAPVQSVNGKTGAVSLTYTDLSAVSTGTVDQHIAGVKRFIGSRLELASNSPGFWLSENDGNYSMYQVLDGDIMQWQLRTANFGNSIVDMPLRMEFATKTITTDYLLRPRTTSKDDIGSGAYRYKKMWATAADISQNLSINGYGLFIGTTAPTATRSGDVWLDISTSTVTVKKWSGTAWV